MSTAGRLKDVKSKVHAFHFFDIEGGSQTPIRVDVSQPQKYHAVVALVVAGLALFGSFGGTGLEFSLTPSIDDRRASHAGDSCQALCVWEERCQR